MAYLTNSAEHVNQYAQYILGKLYLTGQGVKQDREQAWGYFYESAEQGNEYADFFLEHFDQARRPKAGNRTVLLPAPVLKVLKAYQKTVHSRWMFPSPVKEDSPMDPAAVRKRLQTVLERAECKRLRFHDLRHPYVKHTTKKYNSEKQKTQATKMDLIAWVFRFCTFNYSKRSWTL